MEPLRFQRPGPTEGLGTLRFESCHVAAEARATPSTHGGSDGPKEIGDASVPIRAGADFLPGPLLCLSRKPRWAVRTSRHHPPARQVSLGWLVTRTWPSEGCGNKLLDARTEGSASTSSLRRRHSKTLNPAPEAAKGDFDGTVFQPEHFDRLDQQVVFRSNITVMKAALAGSTACNDDVTMSPRRGQHHPATDAQPSARIRSFFQQHRTWTKTRYGSSGRQWQTMGLPCARCWMHPPRR